MNKRNRDGKFWLSPLLQDDPARDGTPIATTDPRHAYHGLVVSCEDADQCTYRVEHGDGAYWLVTKGADGIYEIIDGPDKINPYSTDSRILTAVKAYIKREARQN
jgi:hypothetical protein